MQISESYSVATNSDQKSNGNLKFGYWGFLLLVFTYILYFRRNQLFTSEITEIDLAVFAVWVILMLLPLVSEVSVLGVSLKKEIKEFKDEIKSDLNDLKISLHNVISMSTRMTQNVNLAYPNPSPEQRLDILENNMRDLMRSGEDQTSIDFRGVMRESQIQSSLNEQIERDIVDLFNIRYKLEKEIRRIALNNLNEESVKNRPITFILNNLRQNNSIDTRMIGLIREVYAITSKAIHGEQVTEKQIVFVRDVSQNILNYLNSIS